MRRITALTALAVATCWLTVQAQTPTTPPATKTAPATATAPATTPATAPAPRVTCTGVLHDVDYKRLEPEQLVVMLEVTADPAILFPAAVTADKAVDELGNSLVRPGPPPDVLPGIDKYLSPREAGAHAVGVVLKAPPAKVDMGRSLKLLEGTIPAAVATKKETLTVAVPQEKVCDLQGGVKVRFKSFMMQPGQCVVHCTFDLPAEIPPAQRSNWRCRIEALQGKPVGDTGEWWSAGDMDLPEGLSISKTLMIIRPSVLAPAPPPKEIQVELIVETKPLPIPFRLENVPLP
jgi:hypothetical protein